MQKIRTVGVQQGNECVRYSIDSSDKSSLTVKDLTFQNINGLVIAVVTLMDDTKHEFYGFPTVIYAR